MSSKSPDLSNFSSAELSDDELDNVFQHIYRRLAVCRNDSLMYADLECMLAPGKEDAKAKRTDEFGHNIDEWAQTVIEKAWIACHPKQSPEQCPQLDRFAETSTGRLPPLPDYRHLEKLMNTILLLLVTSYKEYSARTRTFLSEFGALNEEAIVATLKDPDRAVKKAQEAAENTSKEHADNRKMFRRVGLGLAAVGGGVLVGVTGGLAAPLVGAGVTTILGWLGIGGTAAGLLASGLAGSSVVCGALFGAYGAKSTAEMVGRHTKEITDLAVVPVSPRSVHDTMAVRLCITGWLSTPDEVTAPWTVFGGDDTFALQWEVQALQDLSNALYSLVKSHSLKYVKAEIIRRTIFANLMSSLAPIAWLKIGQIIDNPWMNASALADKTGAVLADLLAQRVFGKRPITLVGYSLGARVIFQALKQLAQLPPKDTAHLIQDVFLFGTPVTTDPAVWTGIRRLVAGRVVNGHSANDYVLAVLSRASSGQWEIAGLQPVQVKGVENVLCEEVNGHTKWRGLIGKCLQDCGAPGIIETEVAKQLAVVAAQLNKEDEAMSPEEADKLAEKGPPEEEEKEGDIDAAEPKEHKSPPKEKT
ncbi:DUF726-domain-containing protein [Schizophyllum amplum]|uniref:DUF726-domain-containing protein n=1 Tax=Schizophyllum amplum TaxID=97359 RepID=A0A550CCW5_9AGAR|nr:DUF726-domain-containing protein [Auriculariopsis ampla]